MANRKISDLTALTAPATGDLLPIVDISEAVAADKNKKITYGELLSSAPAGSAAAPSFSFDGDPNTGIYNPGADQLAISTAGSGRLFVDASGNIGINTASPQNYGAGYTPLTIDASTSPSIELRVAGTRYGRIYASTSSLNLDTWAATPMIFGINTDEKMRLTSTGLGVGTSVPDIFSRSHAQVVGISSASGNSYIQLNGSTGNRGGIELGAGGTRYGTLQAEASGLDLGTNAAIPISLSTNNVTRVTIDSAGRVGIGASPAQVLDVQGGANRTPIAFKGNASGTGYLYADNSSFGIKTSAGSLTGTDAFVGVDTANTILFLTSGAEKARFDSSGRLGVGISTPAYTLVAKGGVATTGIVASIINPVSGGNSKIHFTDDATYNWTAGTVGNAFAITPSEASTSSGTPALYIDSSSRVGIGTSDPTSGSSSYYDDLVVRNATAGTGAGITIQSNSTDGFSGLNLRKADGTDLGKFVTDSSNGKLYIETAGSAAITVDSSQRVGIGTSPAVALDVYGAINLRSQYNLTWGGAYGANIPTIVGDSSAAYLAIYPAGSTSGEKVRIDSSGRLLVGTSSSSADTRVVIAGASSGYSGAGLYLANTGSSPADGVALGLISFTDSNHGDAAIIRASRDGGTWTSGSSQPTRLTFSTTADGASSPTERMRITNGGLIDIGGLYSVGANAIRFDVQGTNFSRNTTSSATHIYFANPNGGVGSIATNGSATAYNTSSDYRLKENVVPVPDGITRLLQLKPSRFNFIADPDKTVDGFLAHEVQTIVPEAITGEKDAVDDEGNPVMQGIDQSKLVPLLTAALQEAIAKIETLEARLTAAGIE